MSGLSLSNRLSGSTGLSPGGGFSRGSGLSFGGFNVSPVYTANFLLGAVPTGVTVSSPSLGGLITDATGKLTYKPNNLLTYSNTFSNAAWVLTNATIAAGATDPIGGTTAFTLTATAANGAILQGPIGTGYKGNTINSIWIRRKTGSGTIQTLDSNGNWQSASITSQWQQISIASTQTGPSYYNGVKIFTSGDAVDIYGATLSAVTYETSPRPGDQVVTTASAYYGPAFDYSATSVGTPLGLRIWEQRQNLFLQSSTNYATNASWSVPGGSYTTSVGSQSSPDGTSSAYKIIPSTSNQQHYFYQSVTYSAGVGTISIFAKASGYTKILLFIDTTSNAQAWFDVNAGTVGTISGSAASKTASVFSYGNGWFRLSFSATRSSSNTACGFFSGNTTETISFAGDGTSGVILWGAQFENVSSFVGPYIPTGSAAVTAAADVVTLTGTPLTTLQSSAATLVQEAQAGPGTSISYVGTSGSTSLFEYYSATQVQNWNGTVGLRATLGSGAVTVPFRAGLAFSAAGRSIVANNGTVGSDANSAGTISALYLGSYGGSGRFIDGYVRSLAVYNQRLSNAQLQAKTVVGAPY